MTNSKALMEQGKQAGEGGLGWGAGVAPSVLQLACEGRTRREVALARPCELEAQVCCLVGREKDKVKSLYTLVVLE